MSETMEQVDLDTLLADAHRVVDALQTVELTGYADGEVLGALRSFETLRRRLEPVDHALILEVEARGIPGHHPVSGSGAVAAAGVDHRHPRGQRPGPGRAGRRNAAHPVG